MNNTRETFSVEFAPDYNDDTFNGTFDECKKYLQDRNEDMLDEVKKCKNC